VEPLTTESTTINPLDALRIVRSAGKAIFAQAALHGQLARVEWAQERSRLATMLVVALLGFSAVLCVMLFTGVLVVAFSWDSAYRIPAAIAVVLVYLLGIVIAWRRLQALSALGDQAFAATREELAADIALIKSKL
jgi:uncharacterized membrane protein YqjE